jgi:hypothetical protein
MISFNKRWLPALTLFVVLAIAALIRVPSFGQLPRGLNRDEAALAYNAFSILKTGHDEHGVKLPITFRSFGDEKLGGYIYALVPFVSIFGLNTWATRLPSFLAGVVIIFLAGSIIDVLTKSFWKPEQCAFARVVAMIGLAVSPWANHFSRVAYEAHLAMMCFLFGWFALQKALENEKRQRFWLAGAGLGFAYSLITYHSYQVIVPIFLLVSLLVIRKQLPKLDRVGMGLGLGFGLIALGLLISNNAIAANLTKHAGISPYSQVAIQRQFSLTRLALPTPAIVNKLISNKLTETTLIFVKNMTSVVSADFLFVSGTYQDVHNPGEMANLHLLTLPFILVGLHFLVKQKGSTARKLFFAWLLISLVPSALTIMPQHTIRASALFPALEILAALGVTSIYFTLKKFWRVPFIIAVAGLFTLSALRLHAEYFVLAPKRDEDKSHEKYHLLAQKLTEESKKFDLVFTQQPSLSPYIWYLFESGYDPSQLQKNVTYYSEDAEHFKHVKQIDNVIFSTIEWDDLRDITREKTISLIFRPEEIPSEMREGGEIAYKETLHDSYGKAVYEVWHMGPSK